MSTADQRVAELTAAIRAHDPNVGPVEAQRRAVSIAREEAFEDLKRALQSVTVQDMMDEAVNATVLTANPEGWMNTASGGDPNDLRLVQDAEGNPYDYDGELAFRDATAVWDAAEAEYLTSDALRYAEAMRDGLKAANPSMSLERLRELVPDPSRAHGDRPTREVAPVPGPFDHEGEYERVSHIALVDMTPEERAVSDSPEYNGWLRSKYGLPPLS